MDVIEQMIGQREKAIDEAQGHMIKFVKKYGKSGPAAVVQFYADTIVKLETEIALLNEVDRRQREV